MGAKEYSSEHDGRDAKAGTWLLQGRPGSTAGRAVFRCGLAASVLWPPEAFDTMLKHRQPPQCATMKDPAEGVSPQSHFRDTFVPVRDGLCLSRAPLSCG
jgi:hypothetical protein